jgi:SulP family sulfate permease
VIPTTIVGLLTLGLIVALLATRLRRFAFIIAIGAATLLLAILNIPQLPTAALFDQVQTVGDITTIPRSLPRLVLPNPSFILPMLLPALSLAIIGLIQGAGVSQGTPNPNGKFPNVSRDFFGQGAANIAAGFFGGIPAGGSSSGTALVTSAGARSRWANIFAGLFVALIVLLLANVVELVAMPALAGLVIVAGIQMINVNNIQIVWQTNPVSRAIMVITFVSTLMIPLQFAVLLGIALSIILFVFQQSNILQIVEWDVQDSGWPVEKPVSKQLESNQVTILFPYGNLFYAAADALEKKLPSPDGTQRPVVILILRGMDDLGSTVIGTLHRYAASLYACNGKLMLVGVSPSLHNQLQRTGMVTFL